MLLKQASPALKTSINNKDYNSKTKDDFIKSVIELAEKE